jgi:hypothetical protein
MSHYLIFVTKMADSIQSRSRRNFQRRCALSYHFKTFHKIRHNQSWGK